MSMTENERMLAGLLYDPFRAETPWSTAREAVKRFNDSEFWKNDDALRELKKIFAAVGEDVVLTPPFYCDHGSKITFGNHFYANTGLTILDENDVIFGNRVFLGPHVSIYTAGHPIDAAVRATGLEYAKPVRIGNDVWIGGNVVINPGITIGDDVVIGSGSVVTRDIPSHSVAAGNPCRVMRRIEENDRVFWGTQLSEYMKIH